MTKKVTKYIKQVDYFWSYTMMKTMLAQYKRDYTDISVLYICLNLSQSFQLFCSPDGRFGYGSVQQRAQASVQPFNTVTLNRLFHTVTWRKTEAMFYCTHSNFHIHSSIEMCVLRSEYSHSFERIPATRVATDQSF